MTDKDRLDWLAQNFFHSEMDDIDKKLHPNQTAWRFFGLKNDQGDIRKIIDNAMNHEGYQQTDNESDIVKDAERYRYLKNNNAQIIAVEMNAEVIVQQIQLLGQKDGLNLKVGV